MVQRLQSNEYLKRYDNMAAGERRAYEERVGEWLNNGAPLLEMKTDDFEARLQNVQQVSTGWNDQECQAFEEGARLLSALASTGETWLPDMLYVKSAKRAVRKVTEMLETIFADVKAKNNNIPVGPIVDPEAKEVPALITGKATQAVASFQPGAGDGDIAGGDHKGETKVKAAPVRPKHIDQYVHLLPQKTQERAAQVKDLLRELDEAREKMRLLMDDKTASAADREAWAKKATGTDNKVRKIYEELDSEWAKLVKSGRVVVDDLGNARVVEAAASEQKAASEREQNGACTSSAEREQSRPEDRARRRELRKWLVDTRRGNGDSRKEHVAKWKENFKEFLSFEGDAAFEDEKIKAAAEHYGINLKKQKK